jgi:NADH-quinone oxidoreductase subunit G/NADP-reducing hydrogenase subunit HndD
MVDIKINGKEMSLPEGTTILEAAKEAGMHIPTLCHLDLHDIKMVNKVGTCRVCMVEIEGRRNLMPACASVIWPGMAIKTNTRRAVRARRTNVELLLSNHPQECLSCERNLHCQLQALAAELGIRETRYEGDRLRAKKDISSYSLIRNAEKCVLCRRCETMCNDVQSVGVYSCVHRGFETVMGTAFDMPMLDTACTFCGQCVSVCPTAALTETNDVNHVWAAINDPEKYVIAQTAPAIRVALGEAFGMPVGTVVTGKMVTALKQIGFDRVMDTDFAADLTVLEEAKELLHRMEHGGRIPMLTSCCPAWVKFIEHQFPELVEIPSTCKSPHIMFGAVAKTWYADKQGIPPGDIVVVSVMPCIAKKAEAKRPELTKDEHSDVDIVITTRELGRMIREAGLDFANLPDSGFDEPLGQSTGAAALFGSTGGVIEAVMRTVSDWLDEQSNPRGGEAPEPEELEFVQLRGMDGLRRASVTIADREHLIGIASGLGNARALLEEIRDGKSDYTAIEIMACPGGCIAGGGQPYHHDNHIAVKKRQEALYNEDRLMAVRKSHDNAAVLKLYEEFLGEPFGDAAHKLLHTHFEKKQRI